MEQFIVSARKYRPQTFKDVVGQQAITNTLLNAIETNHLAQALLFTGPRGVGKTTCARILARKINQEGYDDPNEDFSFNVFELDAASNNGVDDIRSIIDQVRIPPQTGKYKVYIIINKAMETIWLLMIYFVSLPKLNTNTSKEWEQVDSNLPYIIYKIL
jgi:DNA polymerase-3 subunit gamma/tau